MMMVMMIKTTGVFLKIQGLLFGKQPHNYGKSSCLMGKSAISMAIFNSYVSLMIQ